MQEIDLGTFTLDGIEVKMTIDANSEGDFKITRLEYYIFRRWFTATEQCIEEVGLRFYYKISNRLYEVVDDMIPAA